MNIYRLPASALAPENVGEADADAERLARRAARLHRSSQGLELESLDQRDALVVVRPDGERVRPVLAAGGRVVVGLGDRIEFTDGKQPVISVRLEEE